MKNFAVDLFYDAPLNKEKGTSISAYGMAMHNDYGTLYLSLDILDSSGNINVSATESILPNMSDITSSTLNYTAPGASNFIDMVVMELCLHNRGFIFMWVW